MEETPAVIRPHRFVTKYIEQLVDQTLLYVVITALTVCGAHLRPAPLGKNSETCASVTLTGDVLLQLGCCRSLAASTLDRWLCGSAGVGVHCILCT